MRIGVLGTGHLAEFLIRGAAGMGYQFTVSPRSAVRAAALAASHGVEVAGSNQAVVDGCDLILVCLPAAEGVEILRGLRFRAGQSVLSAMAGARLAAVSAAVAPAAAACAMMPGLANAHGVGPCLLHPGRGEWAAFLGVLGPLHVFEDEGEFVTATAFGAMSGAAFFWMDALIGWYAAQGVDAATARRLVAETVRGNAEVLLNESGSLADIRTGIATPGGITEALVRVLERRGALAAWGEGMDVVLGRVRGQGAEKE